MAVGLVQFDQLAAGADEFGIHGRDGGDGAGDLGGDLHDVAGNIGIIGGLVILTMQGPVRCPGGAGEEADGGQQHEQLLAPDGIRCWGRCRIAHGWVVVVSRSRVRMWP